MRQEASVILSILKERHIAKSDNVNINHLQYQSKVPRLNLSSIQTNIAQNSKQYNRGSLQIKLALNEPNIINNLDGIKSGTKVMKDIPSIQEIDISSLSLRDDNNDVIVCFIFFYIESMRA